VKIWTWVCCIVFWLTLYVYTSALRIGRHVHAFNWSNLAYFSQMVHWHSTACCFIQLPVRVFSRPRVTFLSRNVLLANDRLYALVSVVEILFVCLSICYTRAFFKSQFTTAQGMTSMANAERESITGVWGQCPQRGSRGQSPRWGVRGAKPPWSWTPFCFRMPIGSRKFDHYYVHAAL